MNTLTRKTGFALTLVAALAVVPVDVAAQECEAQLTPSTVPAGEAAVEVTAQLSESVGAVVGVEEADGQVSTALPTDVPRTEMAAEEEPEAIQMSEDGQNVTVWLNTSQAEEGTYEVSFVGDMGTCTAELTVGSLD